VLAGLAVAALVTTAVSVTTAAAPVAKAPAAGAPAAGAVGAAAADRAAGAAPAKAAPGADRAPVAPRLTDLPLPAPVRAAEVVALSRPSTPRFAALGVTWAADPDVGPVAVKFRTRLDAGPWTAWSTTGTDDKEPDTRRGTRGGTEPVWTGPATGVEARITAGPGAALRDVRLTLIDPGADPVDATVAASTATTTTVLNRPVIYSRTQWGADPQLMTWDPEYPPRLVAGFLHHTAGTNDYAAADVPAILRSIYAFHAQTRGWGDIGYNFLVDRFGKTWEGRAGGVDSTVIGAHAGGFNTGTFGVSMVGDFQTAAVPAATTAAVTAMFTWKLARWGLDPTGTVQLTSAGGGTSKYTAGTVVTKYVISGHRDVGNTECPGDLGYALLGPMRTRVKAVVGTDPVLIDPAVTPTTVAYRAATGPRVTALLGRSTAWTVSVSRDCPAAPVRTWSGTGEAVDTRWDLTDDAGRPARPGAYTLRLYPSATATGSAWSTRVTVLPPTTAPALLTGTLPTAGPAGFVPVPPVRVLDTRSAEPVGGASRLDVQVTGVGGVPATGVSAVAVSASGLCGTAAGPLTLWPAGASRPGITSVSVQPGAGTDSALAVVRLGVDGLVSVAGGPGSSDVLLDVVGYLPTGAGPGLHPVTGTRVLDTTLAPAETRLVPVPGGTSATAVLANVAAVTPTAAGTVRVWPAGGAKPAIGSLGYVAGRTTSRRVAVAAAGGQVAVSSDGPAPVRVQLDVTAWYGGPGPVFTAVTPSRVATVTLPAGGAGTVVRVAGTPAGTPVGARTVVASLSARPAARSWFAAWGYGPRPPTADLHAEANTWQTTLVVLPLAADGTVRLFSASAPATAVLDVVGFYR